MAKGHKDKISLKFLAILNDKIILFKKMKIRWAEYILKLGVLLIIMSINYYKFN